MVFDAHCDGHHRSFALPNEKEERAGFL